MSKHLFAVYNERIPSKPTSLLIDNKTVVHRLSHVLRLKTGQTLTLFNEKIHAITKIISIEKDRIELDCIEIKPNKIIEPKAVVAVGFLKKDHFEQLVYNCTEIGATEIQPLITERSHRDIINEHELTRLKKIMVAACEQSKNFSMPVLKKPMELSQFLKQNFEQKIFFSPSGENIQSIRSIESSLLIGPEPDFTEPEKLAIQESGYKEFKLTETVLRAVQAATVGLGIFRSL